MSPEARVAYGAVSAEVRRLLALLSQALARADLEADQSPRDWGHLGSMAAARNHLAEALAVLAGDKEGT